MIDLDNRRVLITQAHMIEFGGSEIVSHEIASAFAKRGADVTIATLVQGPPMADEVGSNPRIRLVDLASDSFLRDIGDRPADLAWVHHQLIPAPLLRNPANTTFVFNHMSWSHPIEYPWSARVEGALANLSLFVSEEVRERQSAAGLEAALAEDRISYFRNPAPAEFFRETIPAPSSRPRVAVISNHIPEEVIGAVALLSDQFSFHYIGNQHAIGAVQERVSPDVLHKFDAIVTIGKTVQYALLAGIPVYCYDYFGGPGWLDEQNFVTAAHSHFSGRGFTQRVPATIAEEFRAGFRAAGRDAILLRATYRAAYDLDLRLDEILASASGRWQGELDDLSVAQHLKTQETVAHYLLSATRARGLADSVHRLELEQSNMRRELDAVRQDRDSLRANHDQLSADRDALRADRDALRADRDALRAARDGLLSASRKADLGSSPPSTR